MSLMGIKHKIPTRRLAPILNVIMKQRQGHIRWLDVMHASLQIAQGMAELHSEYPINIHRMSELHSECTNCTVSTVVK